MQKRSIQHVDAFTRIPWTGNPAGVVVDASGLTDTGMQAIAREMNLSETAFILPATQKGADLRIRWFTPTHEVDLCGHATIASFHALSEAKMYGMEKEGRYRFTIESRSGLLGVSVSKTSSGDTIQFELPRPVFRELKEVPASMLRGAGIEPNEVLKDLPAVTDAYAYIPVRGRKQLHGLRPDFRALSESCISLGVSGLCVFTLETIEKRSAVHSRFFAPALGVDEDPVTGSANGPLGVYLATYGRRAGIEVACDVLPDERIEYLGEQGDVLGRPGRVSIRVAMEGDDVNRVWIAGQAVTVMDAALRSFDKE